MGECTSNPVSVTVTVLPGCASSYNFVSPTDNFYGSNVNLTLKASATITAQNAIMPDAKITYQAGQSVVLQPGFQVYPGTVFKAQIAGCNN
jgi:hypothetical protein